VPGQDLFARLAPVHPALLLADEVPHLLVVGPADFRKRGRASRVAGIAGDGANELAEPGTDVMIL
jgi:hypothetical protein